MHHKNPIHINVRTIDPYRSAVPRIAPARAAWMRRASSAAARRPKPRRT